MERLDVGLQESIVYTDIFLVVQPVVQPVVQRVASCIRGFRTLSSFSALTLLVRSFVTDMTYNVFGGTLNLTDSTTICDRHFH